MTLETFEKARKIILEIDVLKGNSFDRLPNYNKVAENCELIDISGLDFKERLYLDEHLPLKTFIQTYLNAMEDNKQNGIKQLEIELNSL